jgi:hypothetical protein
MTTDATTVADNLRKAKVFISYSRRDMAFADRIEAALKARGFEPLIDRSEIYAFEDWWKRIEALIGRADTVVFVLSPDAVKSDVALKEVTYAASLNKRFAPIVCRRVEDSAVPGALRRLNFIFLMIPSALTRVLMRWPMPWKPTLAGSGSIPNMGKLSGVGQQRGSQPDYCFHRRHWSLPNTGSARGHGMRPSLRRKSAFMWLQVANAPACHSG